MLLAILALSLPNQMSAQQYQILELRPLSGYSQSSAVSINEFGDVAGASSNGDLFSSQGTTWADGTSRSLGFMAKGTYCSAADINNLGVAVGSANSGDPRPLAAVFGGRQAVSVSKGAFNSHAVHISDSGVITGNYTKGTALWQPAIWTPDARKEGRYQQVLLPAYPDSLDNSVFNANESGEAVGFVASASLGQRASIWSNDRRHSISILDQIGNEYGSIANAINEGSQVVGTIFVGNGPLPAMWDLSSQRSFELPLPVGDQTGRATDINDLGDVVGQVGLEDRPVAWIGNEIVDLNIASDSESQGWILLNATRINNSGWIVGDGLYQGQARGFVLKPLQ
ncbi:MAG: hypothetical protein R3C03_07635 [Pirellulaceae bacterium]